MKPHSFPKKDRKILMRRTSQSVFTGSKKGIPVTIKTPRPTSRRPDTSPRSSTPARLEEDLLTEREARDQELPMSLAWFRRKRLLKDGPPFFRVSNRVFYRRGELRAWVANQREAR